MQKVQNTRVYLPLKQLDLKIKTDISPRIVPASRSLIPSGLLKNYSLV